MGDVDNDGKGEFYLLGTNTNYIADYTLNVVKYDLRTLGIQKIGTPRFDNIKYCDFNHDGIIDYYFRSYDGYGIYDLANNTILFERKAKSEPEQTGFSILAIEDIDGDGNIDVFFEESYSGSLEYYTIYYLYSTDTPTTSSSMNQPLSNNFLIKQNYPNPFNPITTIEYEVPFSSAVYITIYDIKGSIIKNVNEYHSSSGVYKYKWSGTNNFGERVSSGTYVYQIRVGDFIQAKKMIFLK
jgi:hypothetical protein